MIYTIQLQLNFQTLVFQIVAIVFIVAFIVYLVKERKK